MLGSDGERGEAVGFGGDEEWRAGGRDGGGWRQAWRLDVEGGRAGKRAGGARNLLGVVAVAGRAERGTDEKDGEQHTEGCAAETLHGPQA